MFKSSLHRLTISTLCCACATVLLAACGGGGGSETPTADMTTLSPNTQIQRDAAATDTTTTTPTAEAETPAASAPAASIPEATQPAKAEAPTPFGQDANLFTLSFSDEFNTYDSSLWNDHIWYEASNATKNYTVEDGKLKIWPQRDASGNFFNRTIDTDGKYYQTYGYFEMEAKLPYGQGTWPAFWLFNHEAGAHPYRPEIDILEAYAGG
ncbi:glycoside hydrolase family 16 protein, partial [Noviherbaspirillum album]